MKQSKRIALLATGSELVTGEILDTNGQAIAQTLSGLGATVGEHVLVDDSPEHLNIALAFLAQHHDAIITIGGLGPTSDDCTRQLVANHLKRPLVFHEDSWSRLTQRMTARNIPIPDMNRQQALFPEGATVFPNANGTADGCALQDQHQWLFMLPGPPNECLPMFHNQVIPLLEAHGFTSDTRLYRWRLMGVSESAIAEQLEPLAKKFHLTFAYRAHSPFLDIKLQLSETADTETQLAAVYALVSPYLVTTENSNLSTQLHHALLSFKGTVSLYDHASKGALAAALITPQTHQKVTVHYGLLPKCNDPDTYQVQVSGLTHYWNPLPAVHTTDLSVTLTHQGHCTQHTTPIFLRGQETLQYVVEYVSFRILSAWFT